MLYLVDEMFKQNNKNVNITFGKPISYKVFDNRFKINIWVNQIKMHVYELGKNKNSEFILNPKAD